MERRDEEIFMESGKLLAPVKRLSSLFAITVVLALAGCGGLSQKETVKPVPKPVPSKPVTKVAPPPKPLTPLELVDSLLPSFVQDKNGWATDIVAAFNALNIPPNRENVCAVLAEIEQESAFQSEPAVPGLPRIVRQELEARRIRYGIPQWVMEKSLARQSPNGKTYNERIDTLKTENDVNDLYEDMISEIPLGKKFLADYNPVRTGGAMQVNVSFANSYAAMKRYPFPYDGSLRNALFSRKGGLYFGIAYLLDYPANYDSMSFRFADYNAGRYSSRNAAFQQAVSMLTGIPLNPDGDLLNYQDGEAVEVPASQTMRALLVIAPRLKMDKATIFRNLMLEKLPVFEQSQLYAKIYALVPTMPRAIVPDIAVRSVKFSRKLTTTAYVKRVEGRYRNCLKK